MARTTRKRRSSAAAPAPEGAPESTETVVTAVVPDKPGAEHNMSALLVHAEALRTLASAVNALTRTGSNLLPEGIVQAEQVQPTYANTNAFAELLEVNKNLTAAPLLAIAPIDIMAEMRRCIPDQQANQLTPFTKYIGGGGPGAAVSFFLGRVNGWPPFQSRGMTLSVPEIVASYLVGHLTVILASKAAGANVPVVPGSW